MGTDPCIPQAGLIFTRKEHLMFIVAGGALFIICLVFLYRFDLYFSASLRYAQLSQSSKTGTHPGASCGYKKLSRKYAWYALGYISLTVLFFIGCLLCIF